MNEDSSQAKMSSAMILLYQYIEKLTWPPIKCKLMVMLSILR